MKKKIIILCGVANSGKTTTLRELVKTKTEHTGTIKMGARTICVKGFSSPQEREDFCKVKKVKENIQKRLDYCKRKFKNAFVLVMPFTIQKRKGRINKDCIVKPIKWLKSRGYSVHIIYLRKVTDADLMMKKITSEEIGSRENSSSKQARELKDFIKKHL